MRGIKSKGFAGIGTWLSGNGVPFLAATKASVSADLTTVHKSNGGSPVALELFAYFGIFVGFQGKPRQLKMPPMQGMQTSAILAVWRSFLMSTNSHLKSSGMSQASG